MNYGFVIDTRSCIGCHACTTACKSENQVPLGVNRTWVKYTETGHFPDTQRAFQVTRCNHCQNPPCVRICPVTAMYQRADGIVEFDSDVCIGCKGCLQACPYDAIYIDPESKTAAKCHFCGHRVTQGLEPACVVVCPTHSILAGDMDDPNSEIARVLAKNPTTVRKPEQGTAPKLFYINGHDVSMHPTALPREPGGLMWSDVVDVHGHNPSPGYGDAALYEVKLRFEDDKASPEPLPRSSSGAAIRPPGTQAVPSGGPIQVSGNNAGHMVSVAYNVSHRVPWHWQVPAYLVTKAIGTGVFLLLAVAVLFGMELAPLTRVLAGAVGVAATLATTALLVSDLERPERFLRILTRPQWKSWLTRGAFLLIGFSAVSGCWFAAEFGAWMELYTLPALASSVFAIATIPLAIGAAVYTAFLFAQCEGRDLWQSPLLPAHLLVQGVIAGAATLAVVSAVVNEPALASVARWTLLGALAGDLFLTLGGEFGVAHASEVAARAAHMITHGKYKRQFWGGAVAVGHVVPLGLLLLPYPLTSALAAVLALVGLYAYEHAFVMAPQEIPNS